MAEYRPGSLTSVLHLFVLSGFSVAQPLFDLISRNPEFLVAHNSRPVDVLALTFLLSACVPLLAVGLQWLACRISLQSGRLLHLILVGFFVSILTLSALRKSGLGTAIPIAVSLGFGFLFVMLYQSRQVVRTFLTILSPCILLFPSLFLYSGALASVAETGSSQVDTADVAVVSSPADIVMVVFDEFPLLSLLDERWTIDAGRFPNLRRLADQSYWFRKAHTVSDGTLISISAILDGLYPVSGRDLLPTLEAHPLNLFTLLQGTYRLEVFENLTRLSPSSAKSQRSFAHRFALLLEDCWIVSLHLLLPSDIAARLLPPVTESWRGFASTGSGPQENPKVDSRLDWGDFPADWTERHRRFEDFIASIGPWEAPTLYFLHSMLPHASWKYLPSGKFYSLHEDPGVRGVIGPNDEGIDVNRWLEDDWPVIQAQQRHLLQVGFVDKLIGDLVERLEKQNLYDSTLIVIVADHGSSFRAGDSRRTVTVGNHPEIISIPMIIKLPGQKSGLISDDNVSTVDLLPTIVDILDIKHTWSFDGQSVLNDSALRSDEKIVFADKGPRYSFDSDLAGMDSLLQRKLSLFGSGGWDSLFRIGPYPTLVGKQVSVLRLSEESRLRVELDGESFLRRMDPTSPFVLSNIRGRIFPAEPSQKEHYLAVAVNQVIRAVTRTLDRAGGLEFSAVAAESAFQAGQNRVDIYEIKESPGELMLALVPSKDLLSARLEESESAIRFSDGRTIPIVADGATGWVFSTLEDERVKIAGWAADLQALGLLDSVVLFEDGNFVGSERTRYPCLDVVESFGSQAILDSGFLFELPVTSILDLSQKEIRLFAISKRGVAGELHYPTQADRDQWHFRLNPSRETDPVTRNRFLDAKNKQDSGLAPARAPSY